MLQRLLAILLFFSVFPAVLASDDSLETVEVDFPETVSEAVRQTLDSQAYRVNLGGEELAYLWFPGQLGLQAVSSAELGVSFGQLQTGQLVAVIQFLQEWKDYKANPISEGAYTLRYAVQPADGNHMGVSYHRDFLLLVPAAKDNDPSSQPEQEELVSLSSQASGVVHPGVMALFPVYDEVASCQLMKNDLDQWMLVSPLGEVTLGLVLSGHGEVEGY